jgi:hypothetical protein
LRTFLIAGKDYIGVQRLPRPGKTIPASSRCTATHFINELKLTQHYDILSMLVDRKACRKDKTVMGIAVFRLPATFDYPEGVSQ